jgi:hypothetical protein
VRRVIAVLIGCALAAAARDARAGEWGVHAGTDVQFAERYIHHRSHLVGLEYVLPIAKHVVLQPNAEYAEIQGYRRGTDEILVAANLDLCARFGRIGRGGIGWMGMGGGYNYELSRRVRDDERSDLAVKALAGAGWSFGHITPYAQVSAIAYRTARHVHTYGYWPPSRHDTIVVAGLRFPF